VDLAQTRGVSAEDHGLRKRRLPPACLLRKGGGKEKERRKRERATPVGRIEGFCPGEKRARTGKKYGQRPVAERTRAVQEKRGGRERYEPSREKKMLNW